jgi:hypothetical protein
MGSWVHGFMVHGFLVHGFMGSWVLGFMGSWVHAHPRDEAVWKLRNPKSRRPARPGKKRNARNRIMGPNRSGDHRTSRSSRRRNFFPQSRIGYNPLRTHHPHTGQSLSGFSVFIRSTNTGYAPMKVNSTRTELIEIVARIIRCDGSEADIDLLIRRFCESVPHPEALNVLGSSDSPEEIVDAALAYQPRVMGEPNPGSQ